MELLIFFLLGGIFVGVAMITILYNDEGKPTNALERVMRAIERIRGIHETS